MKFDFTRSLYVAILLAAGISFEAQAQTTYQASAHFNNGNVFSYITSRNERMVYDSTLGVMRAPSEKYLGIGRNSMHPGNQVDAILRFNSPGAGTAAITGRVYDADKSCGSGSSSGVVVTVRKNSTVLSQNTILNGNVNGFNMNLSTSVATGDKIDFVVNSRGNSACDLTFMDPKIVFTAGTNPSSWTNEPVGFSNLYNCDFSGTVCGLFDVYKTATFTNIGPVTALNVQLPLGANNGGGQFIQNFPAVKQLYIGTIWSTNTEFEGSSRDTNKLLYVSQPPVDNNFLTWHGPKNQPKTLMWQLQATYDNCHISGYEGGCFNQGDPMGRLRPNVGNATVAAGSGWHKIEVYLKASTTKTSRDGIVRWWLDGRLVGDYRNVNLTPGGFTEFQINPVWDGSSAYQCGIRDCSKSWHHYWDKLRISRGF